MEQDLSPIVPSEGIVIHEETGIYVLCKPKLMPMKSVTIEKLEQMQRNAYTRAMQIHDKEKRNQNS